MPSWLLPILLKYVLPIVIQWLQKEGYINAAESLAAKGAVDIYKEVKSIKVYSAPEDYPNPPSENPATTNLKVDQPTE